MIRGNATRRARALVASCPVAVLLLTAVPAGAGPPPFEVKSDWSKVLAVPAGTNTQVLLYKDAAPRGERKVRGRFDSANEARITIVDPDGRLRTLRRRAVQKVRVPRAWLMRYPGWIATVCTVTVGVLSRSWDLSGGPLMPLALGGGITVGMFHGTAKVQDIYSVPPRNRVP